MALSAAGCAKPAQNESHTSHEAAVSYTVPGEVDQLPTVSSYEPVAPAPSPDASLNAGYLAAHANTFSVIVAQSNTGGTDLPGDKSAPVMDVLVGSDGKLRFKSYQEASKEQNELLGVVLAGESIATATLKKGDVRQIHFRVFQPNQYSQNPEWEPTSQMMFLSHDSNDHGNPAAYVFLSPQQHGNTAALAEVFRHELTHSALGVLGNYLSNPSPEQAQTFAKACATIKEAALQGLQGDTNTIVAGLESMKATVPQHYASAFNKVIQSLQHGAYDKLPVDEKTKTSIPACYLQDPEQAVTQQIKAQHGGTVPDEMNGDDFTKQGDEVVKQWSIALKKHGVYHALSESSYLPPTSENEPYGHPYDNYAELAVGGVNAILNHPDQLAAYIKVLPEDQQGAVEAVLREAHTVLAKHFVNDPGFTGGLNKQYGVFAKAAGIPLERITQ